MKYKQTTMLSMIIFFQGGKTKSWNVEIMSLRICSGKCKPELWSNELLQLFKDVSTGKTMILKKSKISTK